MLDGGLSIVPELQGDAEILSAQQRHGFLQIVLGWGRHTVPDRPGSTNLDLLQFLLLEELDDVAGRLNRDALLDGDDLADRSAGPRNPVADLEILIGTLRLTSRVCTTSRSAPI